MKKYLLILIIMFGSFTGIRAQVANGDGDNVKTDKIIALKIAFISNKLQLSPDDAQKFWPVYNQYNNDMQGVEGRNEDAIKKEEDILNVRKKYLGSFQKVIGTDRVNKLFNAERDFRGILIRRLQNRNQQRLNSFRR